MSQSNTNIESTLPKYLFRLTLFLLFIPLLQSNLNYITVGKLKGHVKKDPKEITFQSQNWLDGVYQNKKENYLKNNFGFRNWMIRLNHQLAFWAYNKPKAWVIIGKDNYLFDPMYTNARNGRDFLGHQRLAELAKKAKEVQDTLNALGKTFLYVVAPSKADYFPEFIPPKHQRKNADVPTNYGILTKEMKKNGTNFLDLNAWFLDMKDTTSYPLFPKTGTHYSSYASFISANRIIYKIEDLIGKDLPNYQWSSCNCTEDIIPFETDVEDLLNLIFRLPNHEMCYPNYSIDKKNKYSPRSITIGDSFFWPMVGVGMTNKIFKDGQFWLYSKFAQPGNIPISKIDLAVELKKTEVVYILQTPGLMKKYLGSYIEILHNYYFKGERNFLRYDDQTAKIIASIKSNPPWFKSIKEKAKKRGIPLDEMLLKDATYLLKKQMAKKKKK